MSNLFTNQFRQSLKDCESRSDAKSQACWEFWFKEHPGMSVFEIVDVQVEMFNMSETTRYRLYKEGRKYARKIFPKNGNHQ